MADRIAAAILSSGTDPANPVAFMLPESPVFVACALGAMKAGRIYVAIDCANPIAWIGQIIEDGHCDLILADAATVDVAAKFRAGGLCVLDTGAVGPAIRREKPGLALTCDAPQQVVYTSGSTGRPKGVLYDHRTLLQSVQLWTELQSITPKDKVCTVYSLTFMAGHKYILIALLNGATFCPFEIRRYGIHALVDWLTREGITVLQISPELLRNLFDAIPSRRRFPTVRSVQICLNRVFAPDAQRCRQHFVDNCVVHNYLGMTEAGEVAISLIDDRLMAESGALPVGKPAPGREIHLLDDNRNEVKDGEVGELFVRSRYLSRGYWRNPEMTAQTFLPDPDGGEARIFKSGDLARVRPDGLIEHIGRKDGRVKIG
ncbi:MAG: AMP-binding protein, partial [Gammaproteobacteria bacterium]